MIKLLNRNRKVTLMFIDSITISCSLVGAFFLRFDFIIPPEFGDILLYWIPMYVGIQLLFFSFSGFYNVIWRFTSLWELLNIIKWVSISCVTGIALIGLYQGMQGYPRSVLLIFYILNVLTVSASRISVRIYYSHFHNKLKNKNETKTKLLLFGAGKTGEKIAREVIQTSSSPFKIVGFIDDNSDLRGASLHGINVLGTVHDINNLNIQFDEILITAPSATGDQMRNIISACKSTGKPYKTVPSLIELIDKDVSLATARDVSYIDLLGRDEVTLDMISIEKMLLGKRILITGAGGSIGSELVKQCLKFNPSELICFDCDEEKIFKFTLQTQSIRSKTLLKPVLGSVLNKKHLIKVFTETRPQIIFHAAAYKHVPIQELHPWTAVSTNVGGTLNMIELADLYSVEKFVMVSTDKAVNPVNVMGATKRVAEKCIQSKNVDSKTQYMAVRFGNVLGSSGSAIPIFEKQIKEGGPVTITHPEMTRFFMSIPEASQLILQSASIGQDGEIFLLEMGKPIKIDQMARDLIRLSGFEPEKDIPIIYTGLRPGEKLYEELQTNDENILHTDHKKIMILINKRQIVPWIELKIMVNELLKAGETLESDKIQVWLRKLLPYYTPRTPMLSSDGYSSTIKGEA